MSNHKNGSVDSDQTVKAGCGIRYDPDTLGEETGFDFSEAQQLAPEKEELKTKPTQSGSDSDPLREHPKP